MGGSGRRLVANGLDVVAVGTNNEGAIVVGMIVRAETRGAVVFAAGFDGSMVELIDLLAALRGECQMEGRWLLIRLI